MDYWVKQGYSSLLFRSCFLTENIHWLVFLPRSQATKKPSCPFTRKLAPASRKLFQLPDTVSYHSLFIAGLHLFTKELFITHVPEPLASIPTSPQHSPSFISIEWLCHFPRRELIQFLHLFHSLLHILSSSIWLPEQAAPGPSTALKTAVMSPQGAWKHFSPLTVNSLVLF